MRVARNIFIVVVILAGLFVAADRIALSVVQNKVAERAQSSEGLTEKPKVSIKGFPFLTQVLARKFHHVSVTANGVSAVNDGRTVQVEDFNADLYDVKLSNGYADAKAARAGGSAKISYAELTKAAPKGISVSYPGGGASDVVRITGSFLGTHLSVLSKVSVGDSTGGSPDTVRLHAETLPKAFTALGLDTQVRKEIDLTPQINHLPQGLDLTRVVSGPDGITVEFGGKGVVLAG